MTIDSALGSAVAAALDAQHVAVAGLAAEPVTLTYFIDDNPTNVATAEGLKTAFEAENPGHQDRDRDASGRRARATTSSRPGWRPARCPMSSSTTPARCSSALNPPQNMLDLTNEPFRPTSSTRSSRSSRSTARSTACRKRRAMGGGILYNKKIYADLGLSRAEDLGRVHGQQREDQGRRQGAGDPDLRRHLDQPALRAGRLLQRAGGRAGLRRPTTPPTRRSTRRRRPRMKGFQRQEEVFKAGYLNADFARRQVRRRRSAWSPPAKALTTRC